MMVINKLNTNLKRETSILPLAIFRMAFGFLMCFSMFRFMYNGWIEDCYITSEFHFTYQFFEWIKPFEISTMYFLVALCGVSALSIGLGLLYRWASLLFFLSFTYLELIEKAWYLNHYYFVSLVGFLLLLVPANRNYSLDKKLGFVPSLNQIPNWAIIILKLQLCTVYFFGGVAKIKSDWLIEAQPLKIWLKAKTDLPVLGWLFDYDITPYLFSWSGMLYDLAIPFLLWSKKTRPIAYVLVVGFHIITYVLFNIGMFPWLMIFGSLIFLTQQEWKNILGAFKINLDEDVSVSTPQTKKYVLTFLTIFFGFQFIFPFRHIVLTDNVLWTENGFRFSWNVMIMEKNGITEFTVVDKNTGKRWIEYPSKHLTEIQEKQMSFQPDMIWQYAQFLKKKHNKEGRNNLSIYVDSKVSLNGRPSQTYINPEIDLTALKNVDEVYSHIIKLKS